MLVSVSVEVLSGVLVVGLLKALVIEYALMLMAGLI